MDAGDTPLLQRADWMNRLAKTGARWLSWTSNSNVCGGEESQKVRKWLDGKEDPKLVLCRIEEHKLDLGGGGMAETDGTEQLRLTDFLALRDGHSRR